MASNKKWFKRAIRTLSMGETELWNLIKNKLTSEQVSYFENQFLGKPEEAQASTAMVEPETNSEANEATPQPEVKKSPTKTKSRKTSTTRNVGKKKTTAKKTKSVSKEK